MAQQVAHKDETYTVLLRTSERLSGTTLQAPEWFVNFETVLPSTHTKYHLSAYLYGQPDADNNTSATDTLLIHMPGFSLNVLDSKAGGHGDVVGLAELYSSPFNSEFGIRPHSREIKPITCTRPNSQHVKITLTDSFNTAFTPAQGWILLLQFSPIISSNVL